MTDTPIQGFVDAFDLWTSVGLPLLLLLGVVVAMIVGGIKNLMSGPDPPDTPDPPDPGDWTCPVCGHPAFYHSVPTCRGKVDGSVGFAGDDEQRCSCTLSRTDLKELERAAACPDCGHPSSYHRGPQCRGAAEHPIGFAQPGQTRCPCTLSRTDLKGHEG